MLTAAPTKYITIKGINNWDTTTVMDFSRAFHNVRMLTSLDIRSWVMTQVGNPDALANMLTGMGSYSPEHLTSITLGPLAVLTNTGLGMLDNGKAFKSETTGRWVMGDPLNPNPAVTNPDVNWFDNNDGLTERYYLGTGSRQADKTALMYIHTYTWDNTVVGGHFDSNRNVWWTFNRATGKLSIGVFDKNALVEYADDWITVTYSAATSTGWRIAPPRPAPRPPGRSTASPSRASAPMAPRARSLRRRWRHGSPTNEGDKQPPRGQART